MKNFFSILLSAVLVFAMTVSASSAAEPIDNVRMSTAGSLEATFTFDQLLEKGNLLIYEDSTTGYKATVVLEENSDNFYRAKYKFEDGDAFFSFKTDFEFADDKLKLTAVHSKAASLPHRKLVVMEYSSLPYGEFLYDEYDGSYFADAGYVTEIREFIKKGISGQGVNLKVYKNGTIHMRRTVLDTSTKGGYDARSVKEIIGSNSKGIILALFVILIVLKNVSKENVRKHSAKINKEED